MNKYYSYNVRCVSNGFTVEANYKVDKPDEYMSRYQSDTYIYNSWDDVVEFLKNNTPTK